jgi:CubicO group peptidase (beta-lactamase class C family)
MHNRREVLLACLAGLAGQSILSRAAANQRGVPAGDFSAVEPLMHRFIEEHHIAGASMAIAYQGRIVSDRGYGFADVETRQPVEPRTLFSTASVSKSITGIGILKLVEEGRLGLNARMVELLGDLRPLRGERIADPRFREITVHELLFHGSGLPHDMPEEKDSTAFDERGKDRGYRALMDERLLFDPGTEHKYSNAGFIILELIIERVTGQRYEPFIHQHVLRPMGIARMQLERPGGYVPEETHRYLPGGRRPAQRRAANWLAPSGALARFASAVAGSGGGPTFLNPRTMALMLEYPPSLRAAGREQERRAHVGLGWDTVETFPNGTFRFSKNGGKPGVQAWLEHLETGIDWALLFNTGEPKEASNPLGEARKMMYGAFAQILGRG